MNQTSYTSTLPAEEVLSQAISPEKKQELIERLTKLKTTLNQIETRMEEESLAAKNETANITKTPLDQEKKIKILQTIGQEIRLNIDVICQVQLSEKYHPLLQSMIKNLETVNNAYSVVLEEIRD